MIQRIVHGEQLLALIVRDPFQQHGVNFVTPDSFSQQLAFMRHGVGKMIPPHVHNEVHREVELTLEVLVIIKGKVRVDFYGFQREYVESRIVVGGDVILLAAGGHGFEILEETEMIEVKQGPYSGDRDKTVFTGIPASAARIAAS
jgi:hypothetical protein